MKQVPRSALLLGFAGLIPFIWGALTMAIPDLGQWTQQTLGGRFVGPYIQLSFGTIILAFMSGVIWGFATKATGQLATMGYGLSAVPALWAFLMVGGGPTAAAINLIAGFLGLLLIDWYFWQVKLAPVWWMHLRVWLTLTVILTLLPIVF